MRPPEGSMAGHIEELNRAIAAMHAAFLDAVYPTLEMFARSIGRAFMVPNYLRDAAEPNVLRDAAEPNVLRPPAPMP